MYVDDLIEFLKNEISSTKIEIIGDYFNHRKVSLTHKLEFLKFDLESAASLKFKYQDDFPNPEIPL